MPMHSTVLAGRISAFAILALATVLLAGCGEEPSNLAGRAYQPLSPEVLTLMQDKGTTEEAPMLIRTYKKEAEFEIWKMKADGHYTLLKTYPMCRWSGQLGPKVREGDRQVPEGFYAITPGQMNPNSNYYLSFNVGYPNAYDRAHGRSGASIMVHGACSSAGCFSMTDQQIAEIYSIAREAFAGGQNAIQMQSLPFHMTAENLAKYRLDPNIEFWKELKTGSDNFEVTGQEVTVGVCNGRYVFDAEAANGGSLEPTAACPPLKHDPMVEAEVLAKQKRDDAKVTELIAEGVAPVRTVYVDGGQNPTFASFTTEVSRPEAITEGPVDIAIDDHRKTPTPAQLRTTEAKDLAEADAAEKKAVELRTAQEAADQPEPVQRAAAAQPQPANPAANPQQDSSGGSILTRLFNPQPQPAAAAPAPTQTAAEQPSPQPQSAEPASDGSETGLSRLYSASQPTRSPPAAQTATASSADSDEATEPTDVPLPPRHKRARAQARKPIVTQDAATKAAPSQPDAAPQPAQQAQTSNPPVQQVRTPNPPAQQVRTANPPAQQAQAPSPPAQEAQSNVFGGLTPILPQGFSASADH
jgi:murein L,D-transpeptidase YafK